jgi:hypothetical protein
VCKWGTTTIVATPKWLWFARSVPENGICIDACIAEQIVDAWSRGVRTLGSCCGHGSTAPNVVLTEDPKQPALARTILHGWTLYQWQLVDVTVPTIPCRTCGKVDGPIPCDCAAGSSGTETTP